MATGKLKSKILKLRNKVHKETLKTRIESLRTTLKESAITIKRVAYGKDDTPEHDREYKMNGSGPVGNIVEWKKFAKQKGITSILVVEKDGSKKNVKVESIHKELSSDERYGTYKKGNQTLYVYGDGYWLLADKNDKRIDSGDEGNPEDAAYKFKRKGFNEESLHKEANPDVVKKLIKKYGPTEEVLEILVSTYGYSMSDAKLVMDKVMNESIHNEANASTFAKFEVTEDGKVIKTFEDRGEAWDFMDEMKQKNPKKTYKWHVKKESFNKENIPSNILEFAKRKGATADVKKIDRWAKKLGKSVKGGTAIGKYYDTLILDLTYQGSEVYIQTDKGTIEVNDQEVTDFKSFKKALEESFKGKESLDLTKSLLKGAAQWNKKTLDFINKVLKSGKITPDGLKGFKKLQALSTDDLKNNQGALNGITQDNWDEWEGPARKGHQTAVDAYNDIVKMAHGKGYNESLKDKIKTLKESISLKEAGRIDFNQIKGKDDGLVILGAGGNLDTFAKEVGKELVGQGIVEAKGNVFGKVLKVTGNLAGNRGRTDAYFQFASSTKVNWAKLAMWRLKFPDAKWPSDYIVNYRGDYAESYKESFKESRTWTRYKVIKKTFVGDVGDIVDVDWDAYDSAVWKNRTNNSTGSPVSNTDIKSMKQIGEYKETFKEANEKLVKDILMKLKKDDRSVVEDIALNWDEFSSAQQITIDNATIKWKKKFKLGEYEESLKEFKVGDKVTYIDTYNKNKIGIIKNITRNWAKIEYKKGSYDEVELSDIKKESFKSRIESLKKSLKEGRGELIKFNGTYAQVQAKVNELQKKNPGKTVEFFVPVFGPDNEYNIVIKKGKESFNKEGIQFKFKVGDRVRLTKDGETYAQKKGRTGQVKDLDIYDGKNVYNINWDKPEPTKGSSDIWDWVFEDILVKR